jgi:hypothetical protein
MSAEKSDAADAIVERAKHVIDTWQIQPTLYVDFARHIVQWSATVAAARIQRLAADDFDRTMEGKDYEVWCTATSVTESCVRSALQQNRGG